MSRLKQVLATAYGGDTVWSESSHPSPGSRVRKIADGRMATVVVGGRESGFGYAPAVVFDDRPNQVSTWDMMDAFVIVSSSNRAMRPSMRYY